MGMGAGWSESGRVAALKFTFTMAACAVACAALWQSCVTDLLYHCSDTVGFDYLQGPSGWIHGTVAGQTGNYGDTIRPGWSLGRLERLWAAMLGASVAFSLVFARSRWSGPPPALMPAALR